MSTITHKQHEARSKHLKGQITRYRNKAKQAMTLEDKVLLLQAATAAQELLTEWRLNYYKLIEGAEPV